MKRLKTVFYVIYTAIILGGIGLDQLVKLLCVRFLKPVGSVPIWEGVLHLTYVENRGAAFGIFSAPDQRWIFMLISSVAIVALGVYLYLGRAQTTLYGVSIAMIVSGGVGNMIDRIALGYVVDMIDFTLIDFAVFNVADIFVCVGAGLMLLALVLDVVREAKEKRAKDGDEGGV